jgi:hypothetical protein
MTEITDEIFDYEEQRVFNSLRNNIRRYGVEALLIDKYGKEIAFSILEKAHFRFNRHKGKTYIIIGVFFLLKGYSRISKFPDDTYSKVFYSIIALIFIGFGIYTYYSASKRLKEI